MIDVSIQKNIKRLKSKKFLFSKYLRFEYLTKRQNKKNFTLTNI